MTDKVFVTHQLPGDRLRELAQLCELNVWMGPGLLSPAGLRAELRGARGWVFSGRDEMPAGGEAGCSRSASTPPSVSSITSVGAPARVATTGVPHAIASTAGSPNPS